MKKIIIMSFAVLLLVSSAALADFIDLPVKWSQTPWDPAGADHHSMGPHGFVVADDFTCDSLDPIVAVRWWGSYLGVGNVRPNGFTAPFHISFHLSMPGGPAAPHPFSTPGPQVYFVTVGAQEVFVGHDTSGEAVYRYDAHIPPFDQWFYSQHSPIPGELWIDIDRPIDQLGQH